jgi:amino acid transporter
MKDNPLRRAATTWGIITALSVFAIFAPHIFGMDELGGFAIELGGFAISFIGFFLAIIGISLTIIYAKRASRLEGIFKGDNLLAHWTYTQDEWRQYTEAECQTQKKRIWTLFHKVTRIILLLGIVFFIFFLGFVFFVYDLEGGLGVLVSTLPLIPLIAFVALFAFVAWFAPWYNYRQNKKYLGEAYIAPDAVYLNRQFYTWKILGAKLQSVILVESESQRVLAFTYSIPINMVRREYTIRVPVPKEQRESAERLAERFSSGIR